MAQEFSETFRTKGSSQQDYDKGWERIFGQKCHYCHARGIELAEVEVGDDKFMVCIDCYEPE